MKNFKISINPLAEFIYATDSKKMAIVKQQKKPKIFMVAPYRSARSSMKRSILNKLSIDEIVTGIEYLQGRVPKSDFQRNDVKNSIDALRMFLELQFPEDFKGLKCRFPKIEGKSVEINGVEVRIAPDIILEYEKDGNVFVGGIKFHISKSLKFSHEQAAIVSTGLKLYLETKIGGDKKFVDSNFCLAVDVFGGRVMKAPVNKEPILYKITSACKEIIALWDAA